MTLSDALFMNGEDKRAAYNDMLYDFSVFDKDVPKHIRERILDCMEEVVSASVRKAMISHASRTKP